jgi:hypothetical protein
MKGFQGNGQQMRLKQAQSVRSHFGQQLIPVTVWAQFVFLTHSVSRSFAEYGFAQSINVWELNPTAEGGI